MDIFEIAARNKIRFDSPRGVLTAEQLFDVPLRSRDGFDLDTVAKTISAELKTDQESFVEERKNPRYGKLEVALDIVKHVIKAKLDAEEEQKVKAERRQEAARLREIIAQKQDDKLAGLSEAQLKKRLAELGE